MKRLESIPYPEGLSKKEILDILLKEEYGYLPSAPYSVTATLDESSEYNGKARDRFCAGKAGTRKFILNCKAEWGEFSFPVYYVYPRNIDKKAPCFIHINFKDAIPDKYQPTEEIIDEGYATLTFCYKDVTSDDGDFTNGLAGVVYPDGKRADDQCGKIGLWAWAAMAVMDFALTLPEIDHTKISVCGHSRLGKTALLTGALDERFYCAFSNDSGCSGAALSRGKEESRETIGKIVDRFPFWFCENYKKYADNEDALPFDQHYLLIANLPHKVYVASAAGDLWASPNNEYLSCIAASEYYKKAGKVGFIHPDRFPEIKDRFHEGDIGYHLRAGLHYFSREDWKYYIEYLNLHFAKEG